MEVRRTTNKDNPMTQRDELKPCPFDNGKAVIAQSSEKTWFVTCLVCDCEIYGNIDGKILSKEEVISYWNHRPEPRMGGDKGIEQAVKVVEETIEELMLSEVEKACFNKVINRALTFSAPRLVELDKFKVNEVIKEVGRLCRGLITEEPFDGVLENVKTFDIAQVICAKFGHTPLRLPERRKVIDTTAGIHDINAYLRHKENVAGWNDYDDAVKKLNPQHASLPTDSK